MRPMIAPVLLLSTLLLTACGHSTTLTAPARAAAATHTQNAVRGGFEDLAGNSVSLAEVAGKPVVLAFLSPDNNDSQAEIPLLLRLAGAYAADDVTIIGAGEHASNVALQDFASSAGITFTLWNDPSGQEAVDRGFNRVPSFQFIRRDGGVASELSGFASRGQLTAAVEALVAGK